MPKVILDDLDSLTNEASARSKINSNSRKIEQALDKTLSRDGTGPNTMEANLDMNGKRILNLAKPVNPTEPLRLQELQFFTEDLDTRVAEAQVAATAANASAQASANSAGESVTAKSLSEAARDRAVEAEGNANSYKQAAELAEVNAELARDASQGFAQNANDLANTAPNSDVPGYPVGTRSARHWASVAQAVAGGVTATGTTFTPYGTLASTNVQGALQELEDDKASYGILAGTQTWTGVNTFVGSFNLSGAAGTTRTFDIATGANRRWRVAVNGVAEGGANVGSDFYIARYDDAGNYLGDAIKFDRKTGAGILEARPSWAGFTPWDNNNLPVTNFAKTILDDSDARSVRITVAAEQNRWYGGGTSDPHYGRAEINWTNSTTTPFALTPGAEYIIVTGYANPTHKWVNLPWTSFNNGEYVVIEFIGTTTGTLPYVTSAGGGSIIYRSVAQNLPIVGGYEKWKFIRCPSGWIAEIIQQPQNVLLDKYYAGGGQSVSPTSWSALWIPDVAAGDNAIWGPNGNSVFWTPVAGTYTVIAHTFATARAGGNASGIVRFGISGNPGNGMEPGWAPAYERYMVVGEDQDRLSVSTTMYFPAGQSVGAAYISSSANVYYNQGHNRQIIRLISR